MIDLTLGKIARSNRQPFKSQFAYARDRFLAESEKLCDPTTLGAPREMRQYLTNRIEAAWKAGVEYGETHPKLKEPRPRSRQRGVVRVRRV